MKQDKDTGSFYSHQNIHHYIGSPSWEKELKAAIASGKVKYTVPKELKPSEDRKILRAQLILRSLLAD